MAQLAERLLSRILQAQVVHELDEKVFFALEVVVKGSGGNTESLCNFPNRECVVAPFGKQSKATTQEFLAIAFVINNFGHWLNTQVFLIGFCAATLPHLRKIGTEISIEIDIL